MKKFAIAVAAGAAITALGTMTAAEAATLRFSDYGPNRGTRAKALEWFAAELDKRSGGEIKVEFHWGGSLLGGKATLKGVADGVADMGTVIGFFTPRELRAYNIGDLPVENSDMWVGMRSMYDLSRNNAALKKEFADAGVVYVTNYTTGPIQLACKKKVASLDDLKGLKIRASGPYGDTFRDLGAEVTSMSQADVYQALDSGLIDCNQNYYYAIQAYKQYEVAPHVLELDWGQNMSFGIAMNKRTYDGLKDSQKKVLEQVSSDFIDHLAKAMISEQEDVKAKMIAGIDGKKIEVTVLPAKEKQRLLEMSGKSIQRWVEAAKKDGIDGAAVLADYRGKIQNHEATLKSKGYPWAK